MKVVFDFQPCQSGSRFRGIGRGSHALMLEMANLLIGHGYEVVCLLNEGFPESLDEVRGDIHGHAPTAKVKNFRFPAPCAPAWPENAWRQMAARVLWERSLAGLEPDFVHVPALLADGWGDDSIGAIGLIGVHIPTALTQHDLIPLAMADAYLPEGAFRDYYFEKLEMAKQADLLLAISEYSRQEAIDLLNFPPAKVVNISSAAEAFFCPAAAPVSEGLENLAGGRISSGFLLYAPGGYDYRKNIRRLLEAYATLPAALRCRHQLVLASQLDGDRREQIEGLARSLGIADSSLVLTDYVSDESLRALYRACYLYVFPSLHEGFGLPVLEAMACGAPVIASDCTSIPEVMGLKEALFDPSSVSAIADKIRLALTDSAFRDRLIRHAAVQPRQFSWRHSAACAVEAIEVHHATLVAEGWQGIRRGALPGVESLLEIVARKLPGVAATSEDLAVFRDCFNHNCQ